MASISKAKQDVEARATEVEVGSSLGLATFSIANHRLPRVNEHNSLHLVVDHNSIFRRMHVDVARLNFPVGAPMEVFGEDIQGQMRELARPRGSYVSDVYGDGWEVTTCGPRCDRSTQLAQGQVYCCTTMSKQMQFPLWLDVDAQIHLPAPQTH
jgi:hypothetical protein